MKKALLLSLTILLFSCGGSDDEGNPCVYEPTLTTEAATNITETSATLNGVISIVSENCEVAPGEMQGFVYSTNPSPTNDDDVEVFYGTDISTSIVGLEPNTTYYVRVFLTNTIGEFYGNEVSFTTEEEITGSCDVVPYDSIVYGTQEWTVENACHINYRDGTSIPQVTDDTEWDSLTTGAWCYYDNDPTKPRLYNWFAVVGIHDTDPNTPNKEFAPEGWHVPSWTEWITLENYLIANGYNYDQSTTGNKIAKAMASNTGWRGSTSLGAVGNDQSLNNDSEFNAVPVGRRVNYGSFQYEGENALFWTSTGSDNDLLANYRYVNYNLNWLRGALNVKKIGHSVRLVRD